jgi:hypothetical protein
MPLWLSPQATAAMRQAYALAVLRGADGMEAAQRVLWAWHPALPAPILAEAAATIIGMGIGMGEPEQ